MVREYLAYLKRGWVIRATFGLVGGGLGFAYYTFVGCNGGCPITGDPWISTAYGAVVGLLAYPGPSSGKNDRQSTSATMKEGETS